MKNRQLSMAALILMLSLSFSACGGNRTDTAGTAEPSGAVEPSGAAESSGAVEPSGAAEPSGAVEPSGAADETKSSADSQEQGQDSENQEEQKETGQTDAAPAADAKEPAAPETLFTFEVRNSTSYSLSSLYIYPDGADEKGGNLLDGGTLEPEDTISVPSGQIEYGNRDPLIVNYTVEYQGTGDESMIYEGIAAGDFLLTLLPDDVEVDEL